MNDYIHSPWIRLEYEDKYIVTDMVGMEVARIPIYNNKEYSECISKLITMSPEIYSMLIDIEAGYDKSNEIKIILKELNDD